MRINPVFTVFLALALIFSFVGCGDNSSPACNCDMSEFAKAVAELEIAVFQCDSTRRANNATLNDRLINLHQTADSAISALSSLYDALVLELEAYSTSLDSLLHPPMPLFGNAQIKWDASASPDVIGYVVTLSGGKEGIVSFVGDTLAHTVDSLIYEDTMFCVVQAIDKEGNYSIPTDMVKFIVGQDR